MKRLILCESSRKRQFPSIERRRALFLPKSAKADLRLLTLTGSSRRRVHDGGKCRCSNILDTLCSSQYAQYPHTHLPLCSISIPPHTYLLNSLYIPNSEYSSVILNRQYWDATHPAIWSEVYAWPPATSILVQHRLKKGWHETEADYIFWLTPIGENTRCDFQLDVHGAVVGVGDGIEVFNENQNKFTAFSIVLFYWFNIVIFFKSIFNCINCSKTNTLDCSLFLYVVRIKLLSFVIVTVYQEDKKWPRVAHYFGLHHGLLRFRLPISDAMVMVYDFFTRSLMPLFRVTNSGLTSPDPLTTSIDKWRFCSIGIKQIKPDVIALWHGWQCRNHWVCSRPVICPFFDTDIFFLKERKKESTITSASARWQISSSVWSLAAIPSRFPIRLLPHWALGLTSGASKRQLSARAINNQLCFDSSLIFVRLLLART